MIRLKAHNKKVSEYSDIDKLILIPKKLWEDFPLGEGEYILSGKKLKLRIYEIPCNCNPVKHVHRIIDLRDKWEELNLSEGIELEIGR